MGQEQRPGDARQGAGQGGDDDEGIEPGLEVHDDQEIDQNDGQDQAGEQLHIGVVHRFRLAVDVERRAAGQLLFHALGDRLDVFQHAPQVTALR